MLAAAIATVMVIALHMEPTLRAPELPKPRRSNRWLKGRRVKAGWM